MPGSLQCDIDPQQHPIGTFGFVVIALNIEQAEHFARRLFTRITGLQDDLHIGIDVADRAHDFFSAHLRHEVVDDYQVEMICTEQGESFHAADRGHDAMAFALEKELAGDERLLLVVDYQNGKSGRFRADPFSRHAQQLRVGRRGFKPGLADPALKASAALNGDASQPDNTSAIFRPGQPKLRRCSRIASNQASVGTLKRAGQSCR